MSLCLLNRRDVDSFEGNKADLLFEQTLAMVKGCQDPTATLDLATRRIPHRANEKAADVTVTRQGRR
eukprot:3873791-Pleurochrysis_carterae.AAC.1